MTKSLSQNTLRFPCHSNVVWLSAAFSLLLSLNGSQCLEQRLSDYHLHFGIVHFIHHFVIDNSCLSCPAPLAQQMEFPILNVGLNLSLANSAPSPVSLQYNSNISLTEPQHSLKAPLISPTSSASRRRGSAWVSVPGHLNIYRSRTLHDSSWSLFTLFSPKLNTEHKRNLSGPFLVPSGAKTARGILDFIEGIIESAEGKEEERTALYERSLMRMR